MEQILLETMKQAPGVAGSVILVIIFLRHMGEARAEYLKSLRDLQTDTIQARGESNVAMKENTIATTTMTAAVQQGSIATQQIGTIVQELSNVVRALSQQHGVSRPPGSWPESPAVSPAPPR